MTKERPAMSAAATSRLKRPRYPMPDFVRTATLQHGLTDKYRSRPGYQQNDYIGWITRAKLKETQQKRLTHWKS
jgi:hypothetical protein